MENVWEASFAANIHRVAVDKYHHDFEGLRAGEYCRAQGKISLNAVAIIANLAFRKKCFVSNMPEMFEHAT